MSKVLVVIPYCAEGAQGNELDLAVRGWRRHFKADFELVLVGDYAPVAFDTFIECPRITHRDDGNYIPHLDHVNKFLTVLRHYPDAEGFIYACDDMYAVRDFTLDDVKRLKYLDDDMGGSLLSPNAWERDVAKTRNLCVYEGLPVRNYVCHLPIWYDRDKLMAIYKKYHCDYDSCVVEDIYFNTYYAGQEADHVDKWRLGLNSTELSEDELRERMKSVTWVTNSPLGWSEKLERVLAEHYNERKD